MTSTDRNEQKRTRERRAFDALRALDLNLPPGEVRRGVEGEEPDFVLTAEQGALGIEITEYYTPARAGAKWRLKAREPLTNTIASEITGEYGLTHVVASIEFDNTTKIDKADIGPIASAIAALIRPAADGPATLHIRQSQSPLPERSPALPLGVLELWAHHRSHMEQPFVGTAWVGTVPEVDEAELLALVKNKEKKLRIYRRHCSAVWLLVVVDPYSAASMGYVPPRYRLASSQFERVIALQGWSYTIAMWDGNPGD